MSFNWLRIIVAAATGLALVACGDTGSQERELRVRVWSDWTHIESVATRFEEENPGVTVEVEGIASPDYFESLAQTLSSTEAPDVTALQVIPGVYTDLVDDGLLADLSGVWEAQSLAEVYRPATVARYTTPEGRQYAISTALQWVPVLYVNESAFAKAGVSVPEDRVMSVSEWESAATDLAEAGYVPLATYGISDEYGAAFLLSSMLRSECGESAYSNFLLNWQSSVKQTTRWTDPCAVDAIRVLSDWSDAGYLGKAPAGQSAENSLRLFQTGQAAMYLSGSWQTKSLATDDLPFRYDWMLLPPASESGLISNIMLADMDGLGVAANSTESELAKEFVAMVSREDIQASDWYLQSAGVSPRADVPFPAAIDSMKSEQLKSADSLGTSGQLTVAVPYHADIPRLLSRMLAGELTEEEVAVRLEDLVQVERSG